MIASISRSSSATCHFDEKPQWTASFSAALQAPNIPTIQASGHVQRLVDHEIGIPSFLTALAMMGVAKGVLSGIGHGVLRRAGFGRRVMATGGGVIFSIPR